MYIEESIWRDYLDNNKELFKIVSKSFIDDFKDFNNYLDNLVSSKDIKKIHELFHELKGIVLNLGAKKLYDSLLDALVYIRNNTINIESIEKLKNVFRDTYSELKQIIEEA